MRLPVGQYWAIFMCFTMGLCFTSADKLTDPRIRKVVYFEKNSTLAVGFDRQPPLNDSLDEYKVILHGDEHKVICSINCTSVPLIDVCKCHYSRDLIFFLSVTNITVRFIRSKGKRVMASLKTTTGFQLYQHLCPESVVNMALSSVNSSMIQVSFQPSENTKLNIGLMSLYEKPLSYKVTLASYQGHQKLMYTQVKFLKTVYWLSERPEQNVAVIFQDLAPNTKYTVSVSGVGGGGEGDANSLNFTTHKSVPIKPPVLPPFSFTRFRSLGLSSPDETCVFITWQPLPKEFTGGSKLYYNVNITRSGTNVSEAINVTTNFMTELLSLDSHHITVWAANEIGQSKNFSQLTIPDLTDFRDMPVYIAFNNDSTADIFVHLSDSYLFQSLAIHWCVSEKSLICRTQTICKGSLHTQHFNVTETGQIYKFNISMVAACKKFTSKTKRKITYIDFESLGDETVERRTAVANVIETEYRLVSQDNEAIGGTCTDTEYITENVEPKAFFVSIKDKENRWMGMMPAKCYYYNDAKTVDVNVNQDYDEMKNIILNIRQRCDKDPPALNAKQFLVKQFEIYSSSSNSCHIQGKLLTIIDNAMNIPVSYKLPPDLLYVCVVAVGQYNNFTISTTIVYSKASISGLSDTAVISLVVAMIVVILAAIFGFFYKKCRDSQQYFEKFWKSGSFANLNQMNNTFGKNINGPTIPNSKHVVEDSVSFHHDLVQELLVTETPVGGIQRHHCRMNVGGSDSGCGRGNSNANSNTDRNSNTGSHEMADSSDSKDTNDRDESNILSVSLSGLQRLDIHETVCCSDLDKEKSVSSVLSSGLHCLDIQGTQSIQNNSSNCSYCLFQAGLDFVTPSDSSY